MAGAVVVSVHDVAPSSLDEVRWLLGRLDAIGAQPRVLKVIPNEHGRGDLRGCPELVDLLRAEQAAGSEVVLHGYTHDAEGPLLGPWPQRLRARAFAGRAAEFLTLDGPAIAGRLALGREILAGAGLEAAGFCAPAWLAPAGLRPLLCRAGFRHLIGMATLEDLASGSRLRLPWLGYMGAGAAQERLIELGGRMNLLLAPAFPAVKVFFHPQNAASSRACGDALACLAELLRERRPVTYAGLLSA